MSEIESKNNNETTKNRLDFFKNKQTLVITSVVIFVLLLAVIPIAIQLITDKDGETNLDNPDTGEIIAGTYSMELQNAGSSEYTFDGNKVTNVYNGTTIEYTYVIAIENGVKVLKLTTVDEEVGSKTTTHEFETGKFGETPIIIINDSIYYLKEE